jgi:hypothetical protein
MRKKKKPHEERTPEDYMEAANTSLELAKVLAGQGKISDQDFLERMARSDDVVDHDGETCGMCHNVILGAQVAREMIEAGEYEDVASSGRRERGGAGRAASSLSCGRTKQRLVVTRIRRLRSGAGSRKTGEGQVERHDGRDSHDGTDDNVEGLHCRRDGQDSGQVASCRVIQQARILVSGSTCARTKPA